MHFSFRGNLLLIIVFGCSFCSSPNKNKNLGKENIISRVIGNPIDSFNLSYPSSKFNDLSYYSLVCDNHYGDVLVAYQVDLLDSVNKLLFFDIDKGNLLHSINLYPYTFNKLKDYYVQSLDSIFIHVLDKNEIRLISFYDENLNSRIWSNSTNQYNIWSSVLNRLDFYKGFFIGRMSDSRYQSMPGSREIFDELFGQKSVFGIFNDTIGEKGFGIYPKAYDKIKNSFLLARLSFPRAVFTINNIAVNFMLSDYIYFINFDSLVVIDSILIKEPVFDIGDMVGFIEENGQIWEDTVLFHAYRTGVFFDISTTPCRKYVLRSAFANGFKRYIYKTNITTKEIEVIEIESNPSYSMLPILPSNDGFYILKHISGDENNPMIYYFSY